MENEESTIVIETRKENTEAILVDCSRCKRQTPVVIIDWHGRRYDLIWSLNALFAYMVVSSVMIVFLFLKVFGL